MTDARRAAISAIVATLLTAALAISLPFADWNASQWIRPDGPASLANVVFAWLVAFLLTRWLLRAGAGTAVSGARAGSHARGTRLSAVLGRLFPATLDARGVLPFAALMFLAWLPVLCFIWPGSSSPDTINMLYQYASPAPTAYWTLGTVADAEFINHHPVLDSLICGAFWELGGLAGDHTWGYFFFALADFAFAALVLAAMLCYASDRLAAPRAAVLLAQAFFMFFPAFPLFFSYMSKDAIFVPWFLLWCLLFADRWRTGGAPSAARFCAFVAVSVMCVLTKQLALYIIAPSVVVLVFHLRGPRARVAAASELVVSAVIALAVFPALVYPAVGGVAPGGTQEVIGTPLNQAVTLYEEDPAAFSESEAETLDRVVYLRQLDERWRTHDPHVIDGVKDWFRPDATDEDVSAFLQLWAEKGIEHPDSYLCATWAVCMPFFAPTQGISLCSFSSDEYLQRKQAQVEYMGLTWTDLGIHQPQEFAEDQLAVQYSLAAAAELPCVGMFFTIGFWSGWLPVFCLVALLARRPRAAWSLAPVGVFWLLQLVNPAALTRYAMPLVALAPFLLMWTVRLMRSQPPQER